MKQEIRCNYCNAKFNSMVDGQFHICPKKDIRWKNPLTRAKKLFRNMIK